jgi:hypothetical protein
VGCEDIERVVVPCEEFDLGSPVACCAGHEAEEDCSGCRKTWSVRFKSIELDEWAR